MYITQCVVGKIISCLASDDFSSVVVHRDQVYAADCSKNQTEVFRYNKTRLPRWLNVISIKHTFKTKNSALTLSISCNNRRKCCSAGDDIIKVYSLNGMLLHTHGTRGSDDAGQLHCPYIGDDDDDGSVLIADWGNDRLQVMSEQGEFSVLQLQPPVSRPRSAVLFNNQLYVTTARSFSANIYKALS